MQYTLRNIPRELDREIRRKAKAEGKSLNQVAVDLLRESLGVGPGAGKRRDLSDIAGSMTPQDARSIEEAVACADEADLRMRRTGHA